MKRRDFLKALCLGLPSAALVASIPKAETITRVTMRYYAYSPGKTMHWYHMHDPVGIVGSWAELDDEALKKIEL